MDFLCSLCNYDLTNYFDKFSFVLTWPGLKRL